MRIWLVVACLAAVVLFENLFAELAIAKKPAQRQTKTNVRAPKKTAPATAEAKAKETPRPNPPPPRAPIDLTNRRAFLFELAELASFPIWSGEGAMQYQANAVGANSKLDDAADFDRAARFDHLRKSDSPDFVVLTERVYQIWAASWRLNRLEGDFGFTNDYLEKQSRNIRLSLGAYVDSSLGDKITVYDHAIVDGELRSVPRTVTVESEQTRRRAGTYYSDFGKLLAGGPARIRTSITVAVARTLLWKQLAELWRVDLMPLLREEAGPDAEKAPVKLLTPAEAKSSGSGGQQWPFGVVKWANFSASPISQAILSVELVDDHGVKVEWYACVPSLKPKQYCMTYLPDTYLNGGPASATKTFGVKGSFVSADCKAGPMDLKLSQPKPKPSAKANNKAQSPPPVGVLADPQAMQAKVEKIAEEVPGLLTLIRDYYSAPQNPAAVRTRLLAAMKVGTKFEGVYRSLRGDLIPLTISFRPFDEASGMVTFDVAMKVNSGMQTIGVYGRLQPERQRGCVVAANSQVVQTYGDIEGLEKSRDQATASGDSDHATALQARIDVMRANQTASFAERDAGGKRMFEHDESDLVTGHTRLVTWPGDIEARTTKGPEFTGLAGTFMYLQDLKKNIDKREPEKRYAEFVLACNVTGNLTFQWFAKRETGPDNWSVELVPLKAVP